MYNYTDFKEALVEQLATEVGEFGIPNIDISTRYTPKSTGAVEQLVIKKVGSKVGLALDIHSLYEERYKNGEDSVEYIAQRLCASMLEQMKEGERIEAQTKHMLEYDFAKDNLVLCAMPLYSDCKDEFPSFKVGCIDVYVRLVVENNGRSTYSCAVTNELLEAWGVSKETLFEDAMDSAPRIHKCEHHKLGALVGDPETKDTPPFVFTSHMEHGSGVGASVVAYKDFLKEAEALCGGDFYIVPSSVDEVIVFPAEQIPSRYALTIMLRHANKEVVPHDEVLSEYTMFYNSETEELEVVDDFEDFEV